MTTQSTSATFLGRSGKVYTFENTAVTDGTAGEEMLSGPSPFALTAQSLGDYAQGDVLVAGIVTAQTNIGCAYVSYGGEIVSTLPIAASNVVNSMQNLQKPIMVKPGMVLQVVTNVVATTQYYLSVETPSQSHIFGYTSTYFTGPLDTTAAPAGSLFVNGQGNPVGFVPLNNSSKSQPMYSKFPITMDLNTRAQIVTDA